MGSETPSCKRHSVARAADDGTLGVRPVAHEQRQGAERTVAAIPQAPVWHRSGAGP